MLSTLHEKWLARQPAWVAPLSPARRVLLDHLAWWRQVAETAPPDRPAHSIVRALESVERDIVRGEG